MDEAVTRYYRQLLKSGFKYAGTIENPSLLLDYEKTEGVLCGKSGNSLYLYAVIRDGLVAEIKYLCTCDPAMNVVGSRSEEFLKRAAIVIDVFRRGLADFVPDTGS